VLPVLWPVVVITVIACAIGGATIGALTGWLTSLTTKCGPKGLWKNASLGSFGFLAGFLVCACVPWPTNTVVGRLEGGGMVATTMNRYQHPERVAVAIAILLPALHELYRFKRARITRPE